MPRKTVFDHEKEPPGSPISNMTTVSVSVLMLVVALTVWLVKLSDKVDRLEERMKHRCHQKEKPDD